MKITIRPKWPFQSPKTVPRLFLPSVLTAGLLGSPFTAYADDGNAIYSVVNRHGHLYLPCVELDDGTIYQANLNQVPNVDQFLFKLDTALLTQPVAGVCAIYDRDKQKISIPVVEVNLGGHQKLYKIDMTVESPAADGAMMFGISPSVSEILPHSRGRLRIALSPFAEETTTRIRKKDEDKGNKGNDDKDNTANENEVGDANEEPKVTVCHKGKNTLSISQASLQDHLGHGDTQGACTDATVAKPDKDNSANQPENDKDNSANQPDNDKDNSGKPANDKTGGNVTAVWLDIKKVKACGDDSGCQMVGGSQRLNLLDLDGKALATLADVALLPATFHQLRLVLGNDNTVVADGDTFSLKTPSAQQSGLKIIGDWIVKAGFTTEIQLAFDVAKSIHFNKGQGYMLKPTIKATVVLTALTPGAGDEGTQPNTPENVGNIKDMAYLPNAKKTYVLYDGGTVAIYVDGFANAPVETITLPGVSNPQGMALGFGENLYIADTGNHRVLKLKASDNGYIPDVIISPSGAFGSQGTGMAQFQSPEDVALGKINGRVVIFVADTSNNRIQRFSATGSFEIAFDGTGSTAGVLNAPRSLTVSSGGGVAVVDNTRLHIFDIAGNSYGAFGQFNKPSKVSKNYITNDYIVADTGNNRVQIFYGNGELKQEMTGLSKPPITAIYFLGQFGEKLSIAPTTGDISQVSIVEVSPDPVDATPTAIVKKFIDALIAEDLSTVKTLLARESDLAVYEQDPARLAHIVERAQSIKEFGLTRKQINLSYVIGITKTEEIIEFALRRNARSKVWEITSF